MTKTIGRPAGTDSKETRSRILKVARSCFTAHGYSGTTLTAIAEAAELTPASIYFHFGNKRAVFVAAAEEISEEVLDRLRTAADSESTFRSKVHALLTATVRVHRDDPQLARFAAAAEVDAQRHPELAEIVQDTDYRALYREMTEFGCQTGEIRPEDMFAVRGLLWSMITGLQHSASFLSLSQYSAVVGAYKRLFDSTLMITPRGE